MVSKVPGPLSWMFSCWLEMHLLGYFGCSCSLQLHPSCEGTLLGGLLSIHTSKI